VRSAATLGDDDDAADGDDDRGCIQASFLEVLLGDLGPYPHTNFFFFPPGLARSDLDNDDDDDDDDDDEEAFLPCTFLLGDALFADLLP